MDVLLHWLPLLPSLFCLTPIVFPVGAPRILWHRARLATTVAVFTVAALAPVSLRSHTAEASTLILLGLVMLLGAVITRFTAVYLNAEPQQLRTVRALLTVIASAGIVIAAPRMDLLAAAWIVVSLALNTLLLHYPERRTAQLAAHKKFLVSRTAEFCLLLAVALLVRTFGTVEITPLLTAVQAAPVLPPQAVAAMLLIALAVILKSAQVPLHGWLIQVMEAPTPVSALLHAGVINLGGIVLLRLRPLLDGTPAAQLIITAAGSATLLFAGTVMMTRVSIKVRLAWSTCAQMGFLLAECGLGLYSLALLHLIGHSLYKAYAFLTSGTVVQDYRIAARSTARVRLAQPPLWSLALAVLALASTFIAIAKHPLPFHATPEPVAALVVTLGLAPLLARGLHRLRQLPAALLQTLTTLALYLAWHAALAHLLPDASPRTVATQAVFVAAMLLLFALQTLVLRSPHPEWLEPLRTWAFHGFYLDETFSRIVLRIWPVRFASRALDLPPHHLFRKEHA